MRIHTLPLGQMQANCYILEKDGECLIIDPSDTANFILEQVERRRLSITGIIATHGHFDHIMAVGEIQVSMKALNAQILPLYIHKEDEFLLTRIVETARHFLGYEPGVIPVQTTKHLKPGKQKIGNYSFEVIHTPGHTPGSCCLYFKEDNVLFTGDLLFKEGIGRYDFSYSDKDDLVKSLKTILKLPEDTIVYSGHGEETTIGDEKNKIEIF
jgi:glyoxylase-like metal-dependent hydrolase (beta-lactamase superfamily II)